VIEREDIRGRAIMKESREASDYVLVTKRCISAMVLSGNSKAAPGASIRVPNFISGGNGSTFTWSLKVVETVRRQPKLDDLARFQRDTPERMAA
jgi:hypothetical protein